MTTPWNSWYHCNTYGTWLRGDTRGWRERKHRLHVDGDYKNPPTPSKQQAAIFQRSKKLLKKQPVELTTQQMLIAGKLMVQRFLDANIELLSLALDSHHFHLVARFPDRQPKKYIGFAKQRAAYLLIKQFDSLNAPIWAKGCRCLPIENRTHQVRSVNYDLDHAERSAYTWSFREPYPEL